MLKRANLSGNPNLGVYISITDQIAIVPLNLSQDNEATLIEDLNVDVVKTTISGSNLAGALSVGNSNGLIVSPHVLDRELSILKSAGINVSQINDKYTAAGNIILANDYGAIASPLLSKRSIKTIEDTLDVEVVRSSILNMDIIGSIATTTNKGTLLHREASEEDIDLVEDVLKVHADLGTVGRGIALVGACSISNSNGALVPENTTGPEMARLEEALGFTDFDDY
ncbi:translation initiation factor IF-6 [Methanobrevibacter filiformis]|uniref:Translation initiation factor 6 n=1 Tax=Methanobrevibacter filiformis TaxID=55758 RepID=A0A166E2T5_9EURY|nr:translation initiation factor IF-6 [Methanobrevibacter filiformis]KZX16218.1 translation initiation factor IF-6 [Methanobrevibacter filiformis]